MDIAKTISLLELKSKEAVYIASLRYNNPEYRPWRRNVEDILETAFGVNSTEYKRVHDRKIGTTRTKYIQSAYKTLIQVLQQEINSIIQKYEILGLETTSATVSSNLTKTPYAHDSKADWEAIENEYDVSKRSFGKRINFVSDSHKRRIKFLESSITFLFFVLFKN